MGSDKLRVIYVTGCGASGSTLLGMMLGAHSEILSIGEVFRLARYYRDGLTCTCSEKVSDCELWAPVWSRLEWDKLIDVDKDSERLFQRSAESKYEAEVVHPLAVRRWRDAFYKAFVSENLPTLQTEHLFSALNLETGKSIFVDTSKVLPRLWYLNRNPNIELTVVYLVRDGRAYINSLRRPRDFGRFPGFLRSIVACVASAVWANEWRQSHANVSAIVDAGELERVVRIRYEELVADPRSALTPLFDSLGLTYDDGIVEYFKGRFHNIAGSPSRISLRPLSLETSWVKSLTWWDYFVFRLIAGRRNVRFGYGSFCPADPLQEQQY